ncbi:hypothetical protein Anas_01789 [Armadillidium nasatum]|uniref:Uncharacterized protein n=1 Tax=Armadillidium nasatum TaxID=96803 RepID=A0A5N5TG65_9CRUS|nr:hypothetical protein Anas_01789 [Armadillidium nasatum]
MNNYTKTYLKNVLQQTRNLPIDVSYSFIISQQRRLSESLVDENGSFCENCSCPWSTGYNRLRLLAPPRKLSDIRFLDKRKEIRRISRRQRLRLSLHEDGQNALVSECKVCKGEVVKKFTLPKKKEKKLNSVNVEEEKKLKKKKKKKRNKDLNAGLLVPQELLKDPKLKKKDKDKSLVEIVDLKSKDRLKSSNDNNNNNSKSSSRLYADDELLTHYRHFSAYGEMTKVPLGE